MSTPTALVQKLWIYDLRTNMHFTLKENPLKRSGRFVACCFGGSKRMASPARTRHDRKETDRFKSFRYDDLVKRDKVDLDIFRLKDESLEDSASRPWRAAPVPPWRDELHESAPSRAPRSRIYFSL